jgi:hypothetical protein
VVKPVSFPILSFSFSFSFLFFLLPLEVSSSFPFPVRVMIDHPLLRFSLRPLFLSRAPVNTLRASRSLSILRIFCIALVAESTPSRVPSSTNLPAEALTTKKDDDDEEEEEVEGKVVVSPATKMGSTGIREWLSKRRQEEQQRTGA